METSSELMSKTEARCERERTCCGVSDMQNHVVQKVYMSTNMIDKLSCVNPAPIVEAQWYCDGTDERIQPSVS